MNDIRRIHLAVPTLAMAIFIVASLWYSSLILDLRDIRDFAGLHFFWTAVLGLGPFICLALAALLADGYLRSNRNHGHLAVAALATGLSPWLGSGLH